MDRAPVARAPVGTPLHVMAKPAGAICNLDCDYCFFLAKDQLYPGSTFRMSPALHEAYLRQLLAAHHGMDEVIVTYQGGEPTLMGLDFFRESVALQRKYTPPGLRVRNAIQTNGTLLDDEWGQFLAENDYLVGISIDGPREMHDAYRVDKGGKPTFERVLRGLDVLRRHGVSWNVLTTVNAANADHGAEVYRFLRDELGATFIQLIPVVERAATQPDTLSSPARRSDLPREVQGAAVTSRSVTGAQYGRFLIEVFDEWVHADVGDVFVQMFDTALAHWLGLDQVGMCVHARTCGSALVLEHNGDLYSCDHFVEPEFLLGNIVDKPLGALARSERQRRFGTDKATTLPRQCRECDVRFACNGGCPKDRFLTAADGEAGLNVLCDGYQAFFRHVDAPMRVMARLVGAGRDAAEIREVSGPPHGAAQARVAARRR